LKQPSDICERQGECRSPKKSFCRKKLGLIKEKLPEIAVKVKESKKRNQLVLEARGVSDYEKS
jgi:hypothetical protein